MLTCCRGAIGLQYNPIAIAQWGLANYNLFCESDDLVRSARLSMPPIGWSTISTEFSRSADRPVSLGLGISRHTESSVVFRSGTGQGVSLLLRAHAHSGDLKYQHAAAEAFAALRTPIAEGGVLFEDGEKNLWIEEYLVDPPTHILNGFMWALWGVFDSTGDWRCRCEVHFRSRGSDSSPKSAALRYWILVFVLNSLARASRCWPARSTTSRVQLRVMSKLTGDQSFAENAQKRYKPSIAPAR